MRRTDVPTALELLARRQAGLVTTAQAHEYGLSPGSLTTLTRHGRWTRLRRGVYDVRLPADVAWLGPGTPPRRSAIGSPSWRACRRRLRAVWTALLAYGPDAIAVGKSALVLHGAEGLPVSMRPEVALPRASNRRDLRGLALRQFDHGMRTVPIAGRRVVALEWAVAHAVPELGRRHALAVVDSTLHQRLLTRHRLEVAHDLARGRRGIASRHDIFELADGRAESALESFARADLIDDGIAPDTLQLPFVAVGGRRPERGDMAWRLPRGRFLVVETDGSEYHSSPEAVRADHQRQNRIVSTGKVDLLRFGYADLDRVADDVRAFLNRAR